LAIAPVLNRTQRAEFAKAARREHILAAARRVFASRGFRGTTIADIADEANIALGTIYLYFASKEDVFAALNQQLISLITAALSDVPAGLPLADSVRARIDNVFEACAKNRDLVQLVVLNTDRGSDVANRLRTANEARELPLIDIVEQGMRLGLIRQGDAGIMTKLIKGLVTIAVYQAFVVTDGEDADKYRDACTDMVLAYMQPVTSLARENAAEG
jgi:AcrR family transcriptional regulator